MARDRYHLTGKASGFLELMVEYGHLSHAEVSEILHLRCAAGTDILPIVGTTAAPRTMGVAEVRRAVARWLILRPTTDGEGALLAEDWPLIFS